MSFLLSCASLVRLPDCERRVVTAGSVDTSTMANLHVPSDWISAIFALSRSSPGSVQLLQLSSVSSKKRTVYSHNFSALFWSPNPVKKSCNEKTEKTYAFMQLFYTEIQWCLQIITPETGKRKNVNTKNRGSGIMESESVSKFIELNFRAFCCRFTIDAGCYYFFQNISHNHYKMDFV